MNLAHKSGKVERSLNPKPTMMTIASVDFSLPNRDQLTSVYPTERMQETCSKMAANSEKEEESSNGVYFCDECGQIFTTDDLLKAHASSEHPIR